MAEHATPLVLPPGVLPPPRPAPPPQGAPFDRRFFEQVLPQAVQAYCSQVACTLPLVELRTVDGATHYIRAISAVADQWVALHVQEQHEERPVQVFIPYPTILRVEIHPEPGPELRRMGFLTMADRAAEPALQAAAGPRIPPPAPDAE